MFGLHNPHHHPVWTNDMLGISPPPFSRRVPRTRLLRDPSPPGHPPCNDLFLYTLSIKHCRDDVYHIQLPRSVAFEQINLEVDARRDPAELVLTYVPTQGRCRFLIPRNINLKLIEAKKILRDNTLQLRMPQKEIKTIPVEVLPFADSDSSGYASPIEEKDVFFESEEQVPAPETELAEGEPVPTPLYTAIHPKTREEVNFEEFKVPKDHDCAFHCLGLTRQEACDLLSSQKDNVEVRRIVAAEIEEGFIGFQLPQVMEHQDEVKRLRKEFFDANEKLSSQLRKAKESLDSLGISCKDMEAKDIVAKFGRSQSASILSIVDGLISCLGELKQVEKKIAAFCISKEAFVGFIENYLRIRGSWAGYLRIIDGKERTSFLDAIAMLKGLKVYIWIDSGNRRLELVHESPDTTLNERSTEDVEVIHMLHTNRLSHFNLLVEV